MNYMFFSFEFNDWNWELVTQMKQIRQSENADLHGFFLFHREVTEIHKMN